MKYLISLFLVFSLLLTVMDAQACAVCGCGAGTFYYGTMPLYSKSMAGLRYRASSFRSHVGMGPLFEAREQFRTSEAWLRYYIKPSLQIQASLPYQWNSQATNTSTKWLQGMGDASLMANVRFINTLSDTSAHTVNHSLYLGLGAKLPTGKHRFGSEEGTVQNANFQLGTGSYDALATATHQMRWRQWGLSTDLLLRLNGRNADGYRFGHKFSGSSQIFFVQQWGGLALMPAIGAYAESSQQDLRKDRYVQETGGWLLSGQGSLDAYYRRLSLGFNYQLPLSQYLGDGLLRAQPRCVLQVGLQL
jgi:hypothetical protein